MEECLFCKIVKGEIPAKKYFEDNKVIAFADINPEAPFHALVIPKEHIEGGQISTAGDTIGYMVVLANSLAKENDLKGYRLIMNIGPDSGQQIEHIHLHLLGGKDLGPRLIP